jgi:hypothetical protein
MRTKYADFDECPISIELTFRDLKKLLELIEDVDGPFRRLRSDLKAAKADALESMRSSVEFELKRDESSNA